MQGYLKPVTNASSWTHLKQANPLPEDRYYKWVKDAWAQLDADFVIGKFNPRNESDIRAHLYFCMILKRPQQYLDDLGLVLTTEHRPPWEDPADLRRTDLALLRVRKTSRDNGRSGQDELRLLVEVKETGDEERSSAEVLRKIENDRRKLRDALGLRPPYITGNTRKPVVGFFYRTASRKGIAMGLAVELERLATELANEVVLIFGPKGL